MNLLFKWSLVGNRILPLKIIADVEGGYRVFSESNPAVLYFCAQLGDYELFLNNLVSKLATSNGEVIGVRLVHPNAGDQPLLIVGLDNPLAIPLNEPTNAQWRLHLENFFVKFQEASAINREEKESLQKNLDLVLKEREQLKGVVQWQTKEIELLRLLIEKSKGEHAEHPNHCDSCSCEKESHDYILENELSNSGEDSMQKEELDTGDLPSTSGMSIEMAEPVDPEKPPLMSSESPSEPLTPAEKKNKSEELLWGVAQYIFCQLCPEQASDFKGMEHHFMTAHVDKEKRNCEACPSETVSDLAGHVQQHTSRVYACEFCGKRGRKHFLKSHIRTHTGERPFSCQTCGRCFADASTLRRHQLVHSGVKKHNCPICGVGIARKDNVKVHIRSHGTDAAAFISKP